MSDLDDVVGGVFVIGGDVQANQGALTVQVPHLCQRLQEAPLLRRPLKLPAEPIPHNRPPKLGLFQRLQHRFGVQLLQYSYVSTHREIKKLKGCAAFCLTDFCEDLFVDMENGDISDLRGRFG